MTKVYGQIESLRRVRTELKRKGITRFSSISEINSFTKNYYLERQKIIYESEDQVNLEIEALKADKLSVEKKYKNLHAVEKEKLQNRIDGLKESYNTGQAINGDNMIVSLFKAIRLHFFKFKRANLENNFDRIISEKTREAKRIAIDTSNRLSAYNRKQVIASRCGTRIEELSKIKKVVDELYPLIAGAIGENLVAKELQKLSDNWILINDYSNAFEKPIYNKRENDKIYGFQIDHLLITNSGIFVIETKNWSKESIKNYDLRSPVKQVTRAGHALFVMLNSDSRLEGIDLMKHHWGDKQIPVRSVIVMINHKPREKFKYVAVKTLKELNKYITHFDTIFDDNEVESIAKNLMAIGLPIVPEAAS